MSQITFRSATLDDAKRLLEIYAPYVTNSAITFETSVPSVSEFKQRIANILQRYPYIVAIKDNQILGYAYTSAFKNRSAYDWSVETSIYLAKDARGLGIGKKLYTLLEQISQAQNIVSLNACIAYPKTKDNPYLDMTSPLVHEHLGFVKCAHFHDCAYKFSQWFDMIWMEKHLSHPKEPKPFIAFPEVKAQFFA